MYKFGDTVNLRLTNGEPRKCVVLASQVGGGYILGFEANSSQRYHFNYNYEEITKDGLEQAIRQAKQMDIDDGSTSPHAYKAPIGICQTCGVRKGDHD